MFQKLSRIYGILTDPAAKVGLNDAYKTSQHFPV